jgi:diguanylate cyclase (GGDEF)-like protein
MLSIDILTAYVICGAGALVGAAMLGLVRSPDAATTSALRICAAAFLTLGISLVALLAEAPAPGLAGQALMSSGTLASLVLSAWGLGAIAGEQVNVRATSVLLGLAVFAPLLAAAGGTSAIAMTLTLGMLFASLVALMTTRRFLLAPACPSARVLWLSIAALVLASAMRFAWTLDYAGETPAHLMLVPPVMQPLYAIFYGVLPILVATMLLNLVNDSLHQQLDLRASTDELTGLLTRRALREAAAEHIAQARRFRLEVAVLILDLDHFKRINDQHGHAAGDGVLRRTAQRLRQQLRPDSLLARYGGEEFVALAPVEDLRGARLVAERLRSAIGGVSLTEGANPALAVTVSIGVTLIEAGEALEDALRRADLALYRAKQEGRNQVQVGLRAA